MWDPVRTPNRAIISGITPGAGSMLVSWRLLDPGNPGGTAQPQQMDMCIQPYVDYALWAPFPPPYAVASRGATLRVQLLLSGYSVSQFTQDRQGVIVRGVASTVGTMPSNVVFVSVTAALSPPPPPPQMYVPVGRRRQRTVLQLQAPLEQGDRVNVVVLIRTDSAQAQQLAQRLQGTPPTLLLANLQRSGLGDATGATVTSIVIEMDKDKDEQLSGGPRMAHQCSSCSWSLLRH